MGMWSYANAQVIVNYGSARSDEWEAWSSSYDIEQASYILRRLNEIRELQSVDGNGFTIETTHDGISVSINRGWKNTSPDLEELASDLNILYKSLMLHYRIEDAWQCDRVDIECTYTGIYGEKYKYEKYWHPLKEETIGEDCFVQTEKSWSEREEQESE